MTIYILKHIQKNAVRYDNDSDRVIIKGGDNNYFVVGTIDLRLLYKRFEKDKEIDKLIDSMKSGSKKYKYFKDFIKEKEKILKEAGVKDIKPLSASQKKNRML